MVDFVVGGVVVCYVVAMFGVGGVVCVCWLLFVGCCLLFGVCCSMCGVWCVLLGACWLLFGVVAGVGCCCCCCCWLMLLLLLLVFPVGWCCLFVCVGVWCRLLVFDDGC